MTREEAIRELEFILVGHPETSARGEAVLMAIEALEQPEQKKGKWIESKDTIISGACSCCGWNAIIFETDVAGMPFCPNCGAQMEGEE